ncbi:NAD(P)H-hydrate epimerase [Isosphaeraceae bacterium EP7]
MGIRALSREEVRSIDAKAAVELGLPTLLLMENAGQGAAALIRELAGGPVKVAVVCGAGNNGGDGGVVARHLDGWGFTVKVVWLAAAGAVSGDAGVQRLILEKSGIDQVHWPEPTAAELAGLWNWSDWVVDGLLGTGLSRPLEGVLHAVVESLNASDRPVVALDIPSGLDADTGKPLGLAVRARATATFVAPKLGFDAAGAADYTGEVRVVDIGLPRVALAAFGGGIVKGS